MKEKSYETPSAQPSVREEKPSFASLTYKEKAEKLGENKYLSATTTTLTIYALFGDDIRAGSTSMEADIYFDVVTIFCLVLFTIEILLLSYGKAGYLGSFFFFLDVLATASLVLDITIIAEDMAAGELARAGRAGRAGTKAGRVVRVVRLIRLIRILKLYRHAMAARNRRNNPDMQTNDDDDEEEGEDTVATGAKPDGESMVGKKLSELTTRSVIIMVLAMLFSLPQLQLTAFKSLSVDSRTYGIDRVTGKFIKYYEACVNNGTSDESDYTLLLREQYEREMIWYIAFHNWHSEYDGYGNTAGICEPPAMYCANKFLSHVQWIGFEYGEKAKKWDEGSRKHTCMNPKLSRSDYDLELFRNTTMYGFDTGELNQDFLDRLAMDWPGDKDTPYVDIDEPCSLLTVLPHADEAQYARITGVPASLFYACPTDIRFSERVGIYGLKEEDFYKPKIGDSYFFAMFDQRRMIRQEAAMSVMQTLFVCVVLCFGAMLFSRDANVLVLHPIEKMIARVRMIAKDPLSASKMSDDDLRKEQHLVLKVQRNTQTMHKKWKRFCLNPCAFWNKATVAKEPLETALLEKTITKIGGLLALGFGEAGGDIIEKNMRGSTSAGLKMIPGRRVDAVFGHCTVGHFTEAVEILQDGVMVFVNQIAEIVHGIVDEYLGAPNRNVGQSFLAVWRIRDPVTDLSAIQPTGAEEPCSPQLKGAEESTGVVENSGHAIRRKMTDLALIAFTKICIAVNKSPTLAEYREHPALVTVAHDFRVAMTFGLHYGWGIEGAIGSEFKIDASYISPDVNMVQSVEASTEVFDVPMCLSEHFVALCTPDLRSHCRLIDAVLIPGYRSPFHLYALDLDISKVQVLKPQRAKWKDLNRFKKRMQREIRKRKKSDDDFDAPDIFKSDRDIKQLREMYPASFFMMYELAFRNYEAGEWQVARDMLLRTQSMLGSIDGPSKALLAFMEETDNVCPHGWKGYRQFSVWEQAASARQNKRFAHRKTAARGTRVTGTTGLGLTDLDGTTDGAPLPPKTPKTPKTPSNFVGSPGKIEDRMSSVTLQSGPNPVTASIPEKSKQAWGDVTNAEA